MLTSKQKVRIGAYIETLVGCAYGAGMCRQYTELTGDEHHMAHDMDQGVTGVWAALLLELGIEDVPADTWCAQEALQ